MIENLLKLLAEFSGAPSGKSRAQVLDLLGNPDAAAPQL